MNPSRLEQLLKFWQEDPHDPFNSYALALEYLNEDEDKALFYFEKLLKEHESYIPTYYHAAKFYEEIEERAKAKEIYLKGIQMSQEANDTHAQSELERAYQQFLLEEFE